MSGGSRPWLGTPVRVKVDSVDAEKLEIVLSFKKQDYPSDIKVNNGYVAVFYNPPNDDTSSSGTEEKSSSG